MARVKPRKSARALRAERRDKVAALLATDSSSFADDNVGHAALRAKLFAMTRLQLVEFAESLWFKHENLRVRVVKRMKDIRDLRRV